MNSTYFCDQVKATDFDSIIQDLTPSRDVWRIPRSLYKLIETASAEVRREIVDLFYAWCASGRCSINQDRFEHWAGSLMRKELVDVLARLERAGVIRRTGCARIGFRSIEREFTYDLKQRKPRKTRGNTTGSNGTTFNCSLPSPLDPVISTTGWRVVVLSPGLSVDRSESWIDWCEKTGNEVLKDTQGNTKWGRACKTGIEAIVLPVSLYGLDTTELNEKQINWLQRYVDSMAVGLNWACSIRRHRIYHSMTNCPKSLRSKAQFIHNGKLEPAVTCDIHAAYWCALVSMLPPGEERELLIELLQSRRFYSHLAAAAEREADRQFKIRVQMECLFWTPGWPLSQRPVAQAMAELFPGLHRLIGQLRAKYGVTGCSDLMMRMESQIIRPALVEVASCAPCLPLHDALLVPASVANYAVEVISKHGLRALGFKPSLKIGG